MSVECLKYLLIISINYGNILIFRLKTIKVMANRKKKSKITPAQMKRMFKKHEIRECQVNLHRLSIGMYHVFAFIKFHKRVKYQLENVHIFCYRFFSVPKGTLCKTWYSWLFCAYWTFAQFEHPRSVSEEEIAAV